MLRSHAVASRFRSARKTSPLACGIALALCSAAAFAEPQSAAATASGASATDLDAILVASPALVLRIPVFLAIHVVATVGARKALRAGDFTTWQRDESSRAAAS